MQRHRYYDVTRIKFPAESTQNPAISRVSAQRWERKAFEFS